MATRLEHDTMGEIEVAEEVYWGAQTQRSLEHFRRDYRWHRRTGVDRSRWKRTIQPLPLR